MTVKLYSRLKLLLLEPAPWREVSPLVPFWLLRETFLQPALLISDADPSQTPTQQQLVEWGSHLAVLHVI